MSMISLQQQLKMGMKLTPQQVQYLKLLQLPMLSLEQRVKLELEQNPMLELVEDLEIDIQQTEPSTDEESAEGDKNEEDYYTLEDYIQDENSGYKSPESVPRDDEEYDSPLPSSIPLRERLLTQFHMLHVDIDDDLLVEEILGNVDEDGYLRRDLALIVQDLNLTHDLSITLEHAETILHIIQQLDPPGIAARSLQECLAAQLRVSDIPQPLKELSIRIVEDHFDDLRQRRFDVLQKSLHISQETLKKSLEFIRHLNPKPGEGDFSAQENYVTPDFIISREDGDFMVQLNDRSIPPLRINNAYKAMASAKKGGKKVPSEAKDFIRKKFEAAKWFIASIHQRRTTLLRVMNAIVDKQRQWFEEGEVLKPMIYKDVAGVVGVDISTISRVVNSKYAQTEYGVFPLRYYFTSGLSSESGEDVSNTAVKQRIRDLIAAEAAKKPLNDDAIAKILKEDGIRIARRTVAKYREALGIPIARLRVRI